MRLATTKELVEDIKRLRFRLQYIKDNYSDNTAINFALDATDSEIDNLIKRYEK